MITKYFHCTIMIILVSYPESDIITPFIPFLPKIKKTNCAITKTPLNHHTIHLPSCLYVHNNPTTTVLRHFLYRLRYRLHRPTPILRHHNIGLYRRRRRCQQSPISITQPRRKLPITIAIFSLLLLEYPRCPTLINNSLKVYNVLSIVLRN